MRPGGAFVALVRAKLFELVNRRGRVTVRLGEDLSFPYESRLQFYGDERPYPSFPIEVAWNEYGVEADGASFLFVRGAGAIESSPPTLTLQTSTTAGEVTYVVDLTAGMSFNPAGIIGVYDGATDTGTLYWRDSSTLGSLFRFERHPRGELADGRVTRTNNTGPHAANFFVPGMSKAVNVTVGRKYMVTVHFGSLVMAAPVAGSRWVISLRADATDIGRVVDFTAVAAVQHILNTTAVIPYTPTGTFGDVVSVAFSCLATLTAGVAALSINGNAAVPSYLSVADVGEA